MASLVLLFSEMLHPEDAKLVANTNLFQNQNSRNQHNGSGAAATRSTAASSSSGKRVGWNLAKGLVENAAGGGGGLVEEHLPELRIAVESIWP